MSWESNWTKKGERLGIGGQGETYEVINNQTSRRGVLKQILESYRQDKKSRLRMYQEVNNLRLVKASGGLVPEVIESFTEKLEGTGEMSFVMEFIEGESLDKYISKRAKLSIKESISLIISLCETIKVAHDIGISHRDIKPKNIIVRDGKLILLDFGLSFQKDTAASLTEFETIKNEFLSIAEGVIVGENRRDPRWDLVYLCALLHYCLTGCVPGQLADAQGRLPFEREGYTLREISEAGTLPALRLQSFIAKGLALNRDQRFQDIDELIARLNQVVSDNTEHSLTSIEDAADQAHRQILKNNRKAFLAELNRRISPEWNKFISHISSLSGRLKNSFDLESGTSNSMPVDLEGYNSIGLIFGYRVYSKVNKAKQMHINYCVVCKGNECRVLMHATLCDQKNNIIESQQKWTEVAYFPADQEFPTELSKKHVEQNLVSTLGRLSDALSTT